MEYYQTYKIEYSAFWNNVCYVSSGTKYSRIDQIKILDGVLRQTISLQMFEKLSSTKLSSIVKYFVSSDSEYSLHHDYWSTATFADLKIIDEIKTFKQRMNGPKISKYSA